jgi:hypothetical protein
MVMANDRSCVFHVYAVHILHFQSSFLNHVLFKGIVRYGVIEELSNVSDYAVNREGGCCGQFQVTMPQFTHKDRVKTRITTVSR